MWKLLFQSVRGTAHERSGAPCQDRCLVRLRPTAEGPVLLLACSDGAGSAVHADRGAEVACQGIARIAFADLTEGLTVAAVERDTVLSWLLRLRPLLEREAEDYGVSLADLACTLLLALVGPEAAVFVQVGDGALVVCDGDGVCRPVFWPQNGEYANTTNFITDPTCGEYLAFEKRADRVAELALFTDGLQMLALTFADRSAHQPFFRPLFERLRGSRPGEGLAAALNRFLNSSPVNARSDDDKTLILATRVPAGAAPHTV